MELYQQAADLAAFDRYWRNMESRGDMIHLAHRAYETSPYNRRLRIYSAEEGLVGHDIDDETVAPRRKVAIIGAGRGKELAPYDAPDWEVWALNVVGAWDAQGRLRADRWWEMHEAKAQTADDMAWISKCPFPIYLPPRFAARALPPEGHVIVDTVDGQRWAGAIPNAVAYPLERLERKFGASYWACTFAYQMALALDEGFTDVGLYGVDLAWGTERERTVEWACVSYWLGFLRAHGVRVHMPEGCNLGRHPFRYGVEYTEEIEAVKGYLAKTETLEALRTRVGMGG